jgi:hypothetical protein
MAPVQNAARRVLHEANCDPAAVHHLRCGVQEQTALNLTCARATLLRWRIVIFGGFCGVQKATWRETS